MGQGHQVRGHQAELIRGVARYDGRRDGPAKGIEQSCENDGVTQSAILRGIILYVRLARSPRG